MARDLAGLLGELRISHTYIVGYSMGGAIAQEFARQFPDRVLGLVLCAMMCGDPRAIYAPPSIVRVMRELDGLTRNRPPKLLISRGDSSGIGFLS
jgi:pimeloyl-ACP methyl ester carboxylesterase